MCRFTRCDHYKGLGKVVSAPSSIPECRRENSGSVVEKGLDSRCAVYLAQVQGAAQGKQIDSKPEEERR